MKKKKKKSTYKQFSCIYILINSQVTEKRWHWSNWNLLCISLFNEGYPEFPWLFTVPVYQLTIHTRKAIIDEDGLPMAKTPEIEADHALVVWPWKLLIGGHNLQRKRGKTECEWKKKKKTDMMRRKRERAGLNGKKKWETDIMGRKGERCDGGKKRENIYTWEKRGRWAMGRQTGRHAMGRYRGIYPMGS